MIDRQLIRDFLTKLANKEVDIGDDDSLLVTKMLDSLKIVELVVFLESQFHVIFDGDELNPDNLDTINAIAALLERKGVKGSET
jgi:methoxymalonate biosynthesis acyl carrier protein